MEKENWINEVLDSGNGMTQVFPDELLFSKIQNTINTRYNFPVKWIWVAAASFTILMILNGAILFSEKNKNSTQSEIIVSSIAKSNQLY